MQKIVFLTGAGISVESGLGTFRGGGGLWDKHRIEDVCTVDASELAASAPSAHTKASRSHPAPSKAYYDKSTCSKTYPTGKATSAT